MFFEKFHCPFSYIIVCTPSIFFLSKQFSIKLNWHWQNGKHEFSSDYLNTNTKLDLCINIFMSSINLPFELVTFRAESKRKSLHIINITYLLIYYFRINIKLIHSPCLIIVFNNKQCFLQMHGKKTLFTNDLNRL